jgi:hypothetical protein
MIMLQKRRGQAAMEFLMTYGWAILVVLVVIGALAYYGVLSPENLLPDKCIFSVSLACQDAQLKSDGTAKFRILNSAGEGVDLLSISLTDDNSVTCTRTFTNVRVANGASYTMDLAHDAANPCTHKDKPNEKVKYAVGINYRSERSGFKHSIAGEIFGNVEPVAAATCNNDRTCDATETQVSCPGDCP